MREVLSIKYKAIPSIRCQDCGSNATLFIKTEKMQSGISALIPNALSIEKFKKMDQRAIHDYSFPIELLKADIKAQTYVADIGIPLTISERYRSAIFCRTVYCAGRALSYFYLSIWSATQEDHIGGWDRLPAGKWMFPRWNGAVLTLSELIKYNAEGEQYKAVISFFNSGIQQLAG
jgi:hypothetical protein